MPIEDISSSQFKQLASKATPKWEVIRRQIRQQVLGGDFMPGDALPAELALSEQFHTARNTVRQALDALEQEGVIYRVQGKGTFVAEVKSSSKPLGAHNIFCLIMPSVDRDVYPVLINGFSEGALQLNRQVMLATTSDDIYRQGGILLQILDTKMAGVALVPSIETATPAHHIEQLQANGIPVVICNRPVEGISAPLVTWDWEEIGRMAARHFLNRGHQRIGYYSNVHHARSELHIHGLRSVMAEHGLGMNPKDILTASLKDSDEFRQGIIEQRLGDPDRPTAILCSDDVEAQNMYWAAQSLGLKVPEDLAIIGFGVPSREGMFRKHLTSVTMDGFELGKKAVELLVQMYGGARPITSSEVFYVGLGFAAGQTA